MSDNGTVETVETKDAGLVILTNSQVRIKAIVKELTEMTKSMSRSEAYRIREAAKSLQLALLTAITD